MMLLKFHASLCSFEIYRGYVFRSCWLGSIVKNTTIYFMQLLFRQWLLMLPRQPAAPRQAKRRAWRLPAALMALIEAADQLGRAAGQPAAPEAPATVNLNAAGGCTAPITAALPQAPPHDSTNMDGDDLAHGCGWLAGLAVLGERDRARL